MTAFIEFWVHPWQNSYFVKAMLGGCTIAVVSAVVGCLVVLRRMAFLGDGLAHAMVAGVAGGYLFMKILFGVEAYVPAMLLGGLIAAVLTASLIGLVSRISRIKEDTAIGIMYTGIFSLGVVLVSVFRNYIHIDLLCFIMGDILGITDADLWASAITASLVLGLLILFFRHFQLVTFDPVMAASLGIPVLLMDYLLTTSVALVVVSAVNMVGVILVVGLLITPSATAYLLCDRLDRMMLLASFFGITGVVGGLYLCEGLDSSGGGAIMLFCTLQFLVVFCVAPKYGLLARWFRLRRMVPQQILEDILLHVLHADGRPVRISQIKGYLNGYRRTARAIRQLVTDGLLEETAEGVRLLENGRTEALRLRRSHRLWEAYLEHVGTPAEEIHTRAHELEHLRRPDTVGYLDKILGHPQTDPHGKVIPAEPTVGHERLIPLNRLPWGMTGVIEELVEHAPGLGIDQKIHIAGYADQGENLVVVREDGSRIRIDRETAAQIMVRCR